MEVIIAYNCSNEDYKTATARNQPSLKKGDRVNLINDNFINMYGVWAVVEHKEHGLYYLDPRNITME